MLCSFSSCVCLMINAGQVIYITQTEDSTKTQALITNIKNLTNTYKIKLLKIVWFAGL